MKHRDFYQQMQQQEVEKRARGDESTADLYRAVRNHFRNFNQGKEVACREVTAELVHSFQDWLQRKNLRVNTVNSYLSNLRAMYNRALAGSFNKNLPFAGLHLKREETNKRAIPVRIIQEIASLDLKKEPEKQQAVDLALFSFLACGIPFVDIVHLTKDNLTENGTVLSYHRQKTGALIRMAVTTGMQFLIDRYACPDRQYLFPVLSEETNYEQYKYCLAKENHYLKEICCDLKLSVKLTTYVFRHTWASEAYHRHVPIGIISQALGHSTEKMTRTYLSAFDIEKVAEANKLVSEGVELLMRKEKIPLFI